MISYIINGNKMLGDNQLSYIVGSCLSTDTKPVVGIYFTSMLFETDTQTWYVFDKTKTWKKSSGGGGTTVIANPELAGTEDDLTGLQVENTKYKVSFSSGGEILVVNDVEGTLDKTWKEIYDADYTIVKYYNDVESTGGWYVATIYAAIWRSATRSLGPPSKTYSVFFKSEQGGEMLEYVTNLEDGYPSMVLTN